MNLPAGPSHPSFFERFYRIFNPLEFLQDCTQRYGEIFTLSRTQGSPVVLFSHPQAIRQLFIEDQSRFTIDKENEIIRPLLGEHSLMLLDGSEHQRQRQLLMPAFHQSTMKSYGRTIAEVTQKVIDKWPINVPFAIRSSMQEISLQVVLRVVFGLQPGERLQELRKLLVKLLDQNNNPLISVAFILFPILRKDFGVWSPGGQYAELKGKIDHLIYGEIRERRQYSDLHRTDILQLLVSTVDEAGQSMTDVELHDQLMTLLVAGHETTATAMAWSLYWVHQQPDIEEKVRAELASIPQLDPINICKLPYLSAICSETLRIYPPFLTTLARMIKTESYTLMDYTFQPGTILAPSIYLTHHRDDIYPEPENFKPERFLEKQFSPYEFLPFGGGHRLCIGMTLALSEIKVVLATILNKYQLQLEPNQDIQPVRRGITLAPPSTLSGLM